MVEFKQLSPVQVNFEVFYIVKIRFEIEGCEGNGIAC